MGPLTQFSFQHLFLNSTEHCLSDFDKFLHLFVLDLSSTIESISSTISSIQSTISQIQSDIANHAIIHNEIKRSSSVSNITGTQTYIFNALCIEGAEHALKESELGIVTNGTDTISNVESLNVGNLTVSVEFESVANGITMEVTNSQNLTGVTGELYVTCLNYSN